MNREEFLSSPEVDTFVDWLAGNASSLIVDFDIRRSARVPMRVHRTVQGLDSVIGSYMWRACWYDADGQAVESLDWDSTVHSLARLSNQLRTALQNQSDHEAMQACNAIFEWGGERNSKQGARPFLEAKHANNRLTNYLACARDAFHLRDARLDELDRVENVNSMLTKVYALASGDGLPIYDSRVAAAIACLVEIFRATQGCTWQQIPELLLFPTMYGDQRRRVTRLHADALVSDNATLYYDRPDTATRWASAKLRLGWIIEAVLNRSPQLLASQPHSRMHAFEASLFMIGYDVRCLAPNLAQ